MAVGDRQNRGLTRIMRMARIIGFWFIVGFRQNRGIGGVAGLRTQVRGLRDTVAVGGKRVAPGPMEGCEGYIRKNE
ncbi:MAG: hypothetical protein V6Z81_08180 [Parvularculales bacterium]